MRDARLLIAIETKRQERVQEREVAQFARTNLHVGNLKGHADDKREVGEIKIVGQLLFRKLQTAGVPVGCRIIGIAIKSMRIVQRENGVEQRP